MNASIRRLLPGGACIALLAFAGAAQAQDSDSGFYLGAGLGSTRFESTQVTASIPPQALKVKDSSKTVRVFGGFRVSRYFFVESCTTAFGDVEDGVLDNVGDLQTWRASYGGYDVSAIGNIPLADGAFDIFAKIGVARTKYDELFYDSVDPSFGVDFRQTSTQRSNLFGVGAQFNFGADQNMGIRVEYVTYDVNLLADEQKSTMVSFVHRW